EAAGGGESGSHNAVLEGKRGEADSIVLEIDVLGAPALSEIAGLDQRRAANSHGRRETLRQRQEFRIAPHIERAMLQGSAVRHVGERFVVVAHFERRETLFTIR